MDAVWILVVAGLIGTWLLVAVVAVVRGAARGFDRAPGAEGSEDPADSGPEQPPSA